MKREIHKLKVRIFQFFGLAIDFSSISEGPAAILSNFTENHFVFDGVECGSMEGFLQSPNSTEIPNALGTGNTARQSLHRLSKRRKHHSKEN